MIFNSYSATGKSLKILLVDDVPQGTIARKSILKELGYHVETAENADQALDLLTRHTFALMVTDYKMPGMDGIELIQRVKSDYPSMRTVMLSVMADAMGLTEKATGADAVISKSGTELTQLARTIKNLLAKKPVRKPARTAASSKSVAASKQAEPLFMVKSS
jgi:CheY-like chemotaxis protein